MSNINEVYIDSMEKVCELFFRSEYNENIGRHRDLRVYRGLPDSGFNLITSLQRICKSQKMEIESNILNNFAKYAEIEEPTIKESVWKKMILGQHHGLPTRLLDWSKSPLVALHFATTEGNMDLMDQRDCAIWEINVEALNTRLPKEYTDSIAKYHQNFFSLDMLSELCKRNSGSGMDELKQYDSDMKSEIMVMLEPPSFDARIMNQYSLFSVVPSGVSKVEEILAKNTGCATKYIISKNLKWQIRDMLDQANINERVIYPGLDGIATWIGRHYFVRNLNQISIVKEDICKMDVDMIVNPTDTRFSDYGKVSKQIYEAIGTDCLEEIKKNGKIEKDKPYISDGGKLGRVKIAHIMAPVQALGASLEDLQIAYESTIRAAKESNCKSIALPLLGAGSGGYDVLDVWDIALNACRQFQDENKGYNLNIKITVVDQRTYDVGNKLLNNLNNK